MPNWCFNKVVIVGEKEDISKLRELIGQNDFDFNKIIPMPTEIDEESVGQTVGNTRAFIDGSTKIAHIDLRCKNSKLTFQKDGQPTETFYSLANAIIEGYLVCPECIKEEKFDKPIKDGVALVQKYGFDNWYDWRRANWGTKWNACDSAIKWTDKKILLYFNTAWRPADKIYQKLVEMFPNLKIKWDYFDEQEEYQGSLDKLDENDIDICE